ncbi:MAG TPA: RNA polymerase sigma factor SigM [Actinomycetales bacterium]|nr:RNA polymerase sigma factor SigM [Actinomycetales bacterium]
MSTGAEPTDDRELMAAHVAGDPDAFAELVRRHSGRLWAVALRTCGDPDEAADALQDALVAAFRSAATYRGDAAVTTWLHRIVVNACLDRLRRNRNRRTVPLPDQERELPSHVDVQTDEHAATETRLDLVQALAALPEHQRLALVLVDMEDLPVAEAAEVLGVPQGTVKSRCARGRATLAAMLRGGNPQEPAHVQGPTPDRSTQNPSAGDPSTSHPSTPGDQP